MPRLLRDATLRYFLGGFAIGVAMLVTAELATPAPATASAVATTR